MSEASSSSHSDPQTFAIIGAAMEVHKTLGCGFLEMVYQEALTVELTERGIPFQREIVYPVDYKGIRLDSTFRVDFLCFSEIIVEIKSLPNVSGREMAQILNYLKASGLSRALLLNFGETNLKYERIVNRYKG